MAEVKVKEEQENHRFVLEVKEEPEFREIQSSGDTSSVLHCRKEEAEEVEIKAEPLPQFLHVSVKSEEGEPQSSLLHQTETEDNREDTGSSDTDDSEDWFPAAPQTQKPKENRENSRKRSDSESSWEFEAPPTKTQARTKRPMGDQTASVMEDQESSGRTRSKLRRYQCPVCERCFKTEYQLNTIHMRTHTEKSLRCSVCRKIFYDETKLSRHVMMHMGVKDFSCSVCSRSFTTSVGLGLHIRMHSRQKPRSCSVCGREFTHVGGLNLHMRMHSSERPYSCQVCTKNFRQIGKLKNHMKTHSEKRSANV